MNGTAHIIIPVTSILCLTALCGYALSQQIDGAILLEAIALIGAIAGIPLYSLAKQFKAKPEDKS